MRLQLMQHLLQIYMCNAHYSNVFSTRIYVSVVQLASNMKTTEAKVTDFCGNVFCNTGQYLCLLFN